MEKINDKTNIALMDKPAKRWSFQIMVILAFGVLLALLGLVGWGLTRAQRGQVQSGQAPDFELNTFDNHQIALKDLRGKYVVVNFWASWCQTCRLEAAYLEQTWRKYQDKGVVFIGIDFVDTEPKALDYIKEFNITYPNAPDLGTRMSQAYGIKGVPETFFIGKNGELAGLKIGPMDPPELDLKIDALIADSDQ